VDAETRTAVALTPEAVWEAIDAATDGDTVQLSAGTVVWSKGFNSGHAARMKAITIQGAGIDKTIIGDDRIDHCKFKNADHMLETWNNTFNGTPLRMGAFVTERRDRYSSNRA